jgi:hypothetical protein
LIIDAPGDIRRSRNASELGWYGGWDLNPHVLTDSRV